MGCRSPQTHPVGSIAILRRTSKRPRVRRPSGSRTRGGCNPTEMQLSQSVKGKSMVFAPSTVAFNPEVSLTPYLSGMSFLAF